MKQASTNYATVVISILIALAAGSALADAAVPNQRMSLRGKLPDTANVKGSRPPLEAGKEDVDTVAFRAAEAIREQRHAEAAQLLGRCAALREAKATKLDRRAKRFGHAFPLSLAHKLGLQRRTRVLKRRARRLRVIAARERAGAEQQRRLAAQAEIVVD